MASQQPASDPSSPAQRSTATPARPPPSAAVLDLSTFLRSIQADVHIGSNNRDGTSIANVKALPTRAKASLLDAQMDQVQASLRKTLTDQLQQVRAQTKTASELPGRLKELEQRVRQVKASLSKGSNNSIAVAGQSKGEREGEWVSTPPIAGRV